MSDVTCPYCGAEQEINHDDGYGYEEDQKHEQECVLCNKTFLFTPTMSISYEAYCARPEDHEMRQSPFERTKRVWSCMKCDYYEVRDTPEHVSSGQDDLCVAGGRGSSIGIETKQEETNV